MPNGVPALESAQYIVAIRSAQPHRASRHMAAPSLGQYAALSFVVIGGGQKAGWLIRKLEN